MSGLEVFFIEGVNSSHFFLKRCLLLTSVCTFLQFHIAQAKKGQTRSTVGGTAFKAKLPSRESSTGNNGCD